MPGYRRRLIAGRSRSRRETSWIGIAASTTTLDTGVAALVSSLNAAALALRPFTIVRTYLSIFYGTDNIANESRLGGVGMAVVSDQASAVGVTAVPTPMTELGSDLWYLHQVCLGRTVFSTAAAFDAVGGVQYHIDSKAMRKVNNDQDLILVAESDATQSGAIFNMAGRFLIKEH